jgi:hypothetical protein
MFSTKINRLRAKAVKTVKTAKTFGKTRFERPSHPQRSGRLGRQGQPGRRAPFLKSGQKAAAALLAALQKHKAEILALLRHDGGTPSHILERAAKARKGIAAILLSPIRPFGYSDSQWLEAILDAEKIGYPFKGAQG